MKFIPLITGLAITLTPVLSGQQFSSMPGQGRSMVVTKYGIVAEPQFLASQAGAHILEEGGNAIDAAIAANAVMGVVQPYVNGMGGDLFALYYEAKTGKLYGLNASGWTPKALTIDYFNAHHIDHIDPIGVHTIDIPGCVAGWDAIRSRFGNLPLQKTLAPAISYAQNGFPLAERNARSWENKRLLQQPGYKETYLPGGVAPKLGDMFRNPALAESLRQVAAHGRDAFYNGPMTATMVKFLREQGGTHTLEVFAYFQPEWVEPISTTYRGWKVYELPPNGQGMAALEMLNILEQFSPAKAGPASAEELHKRIEAMKLAYADLARYNADPRFAKIPVAGLLSKEYAAQRAQRINPQKANCDADAGRPPASDTTYLTVVDRDGNIVSLIQSNFSGFGSGITVRGMGFLLQNRGALFLLDPAKPDALAGHKRPFHTIIPAFMERGDDHIGFGIMGGPTQPLAHAQFVSNVVDYGMNLQAAMETARFTVRSNFNIGCKFLIEDRVPGEVRQQLTEMGHQLDLRGDFSLYMGRGQAIDHNTKTGMNFAASDARTDGSAEPEFPPGIHFAGAAVTVEKR